MTFLLPSAQTCGAPYRSHPLGIPCPVSLLPAGSADSYLSMCSFFLSLSMSMPEVISDSSSLTDTDSISSANNLSLSYG